MKFSTLLKTMLVLFLTFFSTSPIKAEEQEDPLNPPQLPVVYQNLQIPSHLTEPSFFSRSNHFTSTIHLQRLTPCHWFHRLEK
ncbi:hypothetical protein [Brevibacillus sp. HB1.4B]|uniref:hypothetical protein n=1 Tax=Brevibacillus sp. HB1.4B TaxID=2738845 RepID=UPI0020C29364|nr:hypothetical protein [Brevibacillus sp. HB1.4B]